MNECNTNLTCQFTRCASLAALGLKKPAVGVSRSPKRRFYQVAYRSRNGTPRARTFSWSNQKGEMPAYAAAVKFRKKLERGLRGRRRR